MRDEGRGVHLRHIHHPHRPTNRLCGLLACGDDSAKMGQLSDESMDVGRLNDLEKLVGGVVLQATDSRRGIVERETFLLTKCHNLVNLETLGFEVHEVVLVAKEYLSLNAPMVIDKVRVVKVHAPPLALGRETTQEQHLCILRQERTQGVVLYPTLTPGNISYV